MTAFDPVLTVIDAASLLITFGMSYYAIKLVMKFKNGMLEKGWRSVAYGAIVLTIAGIVFAAQSSGSAPTLSDALVYAASILSMFGGLLLLFGLRVENDVWELKRQRSTTLANNA